jgi:nicotinamidase-related amidase
MTWPTSGPTNTAADTVKQKLTEASAVDSLAEHSKPFLDWLEKWFAQLGPAALADIAAEPQRVAIASVDLINGFAYEGNLSSPRVAALIPPVERLFRRAHALGVRNFLVIQECHSPNAEEFKAYGPHGICGTREAEMVPELAALPFSKEFVVARKNSLHTITATSAEEWLRQHPAVDTFVVVGDCTDLCAYDLAMDLKLRANQVDLKRRVVVPANCVQTYDLSIETAAEIDALPHDGDFLHSLFLYMMALNKIEVVRELI